MSWKRRNVSSFFIVCFVDETREKNSLFSSSLFSHPKTFQKKKTGDHLHTNYHTLFTFLRSKGYFVDILGSTFDCFSAEDYGKRISSSLLSGFFFFLDERDSKGKKKLTSRSLLFLSLFSLSLSPLFLLSLVLSNPVQTSGALLVVDAEEEYYSSEVDKIARDVKEKGLGLIVFADWFNVAHMASLRFFDDNTRSWWTPPTGGVRSEEGEGEEKCCWQFFSLFRQERERGTHQHTAHLSLSRLFHAAKNKKKQSNVPALNDLLAPFGVAFGDAVLEGPVGGVFVGETPPPAGGGAAAKNGGKSFDYASGTNIARFPAGGTLFEATLTQRASEGVAASPVDGGKESREATDGEGGVTGRHAILGLARAGAGAVAAFGDSGCLDSSHQRGDCFWLLDKILDFAVSGSRDAALFGPPGEEDENAGALAAPFALQTGGNGNAGGDSPLPSRPLGLPSEEALPFSSVTDRNAAPPACEPNSALQFAAPHWPAVAREKAEEGKTEKGKAAGGAAAAASGAAAAGAGAAKPSRKDLLPPKAAAAAAVDGDDAGGSSAAPLHTNSSGRNGKSHHPSSSSSSSSSSSTRPRSPPTSTSSSAAAAAAYLAASYYSSAALIAKNLVRSAGSRAGIGGGGGSRSPPSPVALAGAGAAAALCLWAAVRASIRRRRAAAAGAGGDTGGPGGSKQRYSRVAAPLSPGSLADYGVELGNALRPGALTSSTSRPSAAHMKE